MLPGIAGVIESLGCDIWMHADAKMEGIYEIGSIAPFPSFQHRSIGVSHCSIKG